MDFSKLDALKARLEDLRPFPSEVAHCLRENLVLHWIYHSNAIEGGAFTPEETKRVLENLAIGGKTLREHFEVINHRNGILYIENAVRRKEPFSEWQMRNINRLILKNIDDCNGGRYRRTKSASTNSDKQPEIEPTNMIPILRYAKDRANSACPTSSDSLSVPEAMAGLVRRHLDTSQALHPLERATRIHADFIGIHPFINGNGHTARLLMNLALLKYGYPPAIIPVEKQLRYYDALNLACITKNRIPLLALISECVETNLRWHMQSIKGLISQFAP